ncbi:hypothetical protein YC2023_053903 [Brassica napus]
MEEADWRNHRRSRRSEICSLWKHIRVSWPAIFLTARNHEPIETKKKTTTVSADEDLSSSQGFNNEESVIGRVSVMKMKIRSRDRAYIGNEP